jgi:hypothetical protein
LQNRLGWTALHEACFYHRLETVKTLLLAGADPTIRTNRGALPYHLAGLPEMRNMLENMGGPKAVPGQDDVIDMIQVLTDLTLSDYARSSTKDAGSGNRNRNDDDDDDGQEINVVMQPIIVSGGRSMPMIIISPGSNQHINGTSTEVKQAKTIEDDQESKGISTSTLPSLTTKVSPGKPDQKSESSTIQETEILDKKSPSKKADGKDNKTNKSKKGMDMVHPDIPKEYLCQLTNKPMSEPMKTIYGNVYDKTAIMNWFQTQGRICPLTGEYKYLLQR